MESSQPGFCRVPALVQRTGEEHANPFASACMSSVMGLYYRVRLMRETDFTWNMPPVMTLASVTPIFGTRREVPAAPS